nr:immunoglobulin heavy chain junction region [Mus musculus]
CARDYYYGSSYAPFAYW